MAAMDKTCDFKPMKLQRRPMKESDVVIDMKFCGVCHSDLHNAANDITILGGCKYPIVPGHELAGVCIAVGSKVTKFKVGDHVGVGCLVDSCLSCKACNRGEEQKCKKCVSTYQGQDNGSGRAQTYPENGMTLGGYSTTMVVNEHFAIKIPKEYPLEFAGPVMCAGVTMYDPLRRQNAGRGTRVGIVGLGGLGQMGVSIAKVMGCFVTVISRSQAKSTFAEELGAHNFLLSTSLEGMKRSRKSLDIILNTIPVAHDYNIYKQLLATGGKQVLLGLHPALAAAMIVDQITCHHSKIYPQIEVFPVEELNRVFEALDASNATGTRYVMDIAGTLNSDAFSRCNAPPPILEENRSTFGICNSCFACCQMFWCCKWC
eukprot:GSMAST32.ASY1.ANO1.987.1 assembled CDS